MVSGDGTRVCLGISAAASHSRPTDELSYLKRLLMCIPCRVLGRTYEEIQLLFQIMLGSLIRWSC